MDKPQCGLPIKSFKNHSPIKAEWFLFFFYLLKIITSIIKANTTIVSATRPNKSRYIISNKAASIICTTPYSRNKYCGSKKSGKPHLLILISYAFYYTPFLILFQ